MITLPSIADGLADVVEASEKCEAALWKVNGTAGTCCGWSNGMGMMGGMVEELDSVTCDEEGRVTGISWSINYSDSTSFSYLAPLSHLSSLRLGGPPNPLGFRPFNITGPFPTVVISNLTNLASLSLTFTSLSGSVPDLSGMTRLKNLSLASGNFSGPLPTAATLPRSIEYLDLRGNAFGGALNGTTAFGASKLPNLTFCEFAGNSESPTNITLATTSVDSGNTSSLEDAAEAIAGLAGRLPKTRLSELCFVGARLVCGNNTEDVAGSGTRAGNGNRTGIANGVDGNGTAQLTASVNGMELSPNVTTPVPYFHGVPKCANQSESTIPDTPSVTTTSTSTASTKTTRRAAQTRT